MKSFLKRSSLAAVLMGSFSFYSCGPDHNQGMISKLRSQEDDLAKLSCNEFPQMFHKADEDLALVSSDLEGDDIRVSDDGLKEVCNLFDQESSYSLAGDTSSLGKIMNVILDAAGLNSESKSLGDYLAQKTHGKGLGFYLETGAVVQAATLVEAVVHEGELALFCATGLEVSSTVGASAHFGAIKTMGCNKNDDYKGGFLSISVAGNWPVLPSLSLGTSYAIGIDPESMLKYLVENNPETSSQEIQRVIERIAKLVAQEKLGRYHPYLIEFIAVLKGYLDAKDKSELAEGLKASAEAISKQFETQKNLDGISPDGFAKFLLTHFSPAEEFPLTHHLIKALEISLTGCDSATALAGAGVSASPIGVSLAMTHYELINRAKIDSVIFEDGTFKELWSWLKSYTRNEAENKPTEKVSRLLQEAKQLAGFLGSVKKLSNPASFAQLCVIPTAKATYKNGQSFIEFLRSRIR